MNKNIQVLSKKVWSFDTRTSVYWCAFIIVVASLLQTGYSIHYGNQAFQIPLVYWLTNASLYPNDPFVATLPYYASMLWRVVAWVTQLIPLEPLLLKLFLLERVLVIGAAGYLAQTLIPQSRFAAVGAMLLFALPLQPIVGYGTIVPHYFEQTGFAIPFFLLAIAAFYRVWPLRCAIALAIGFNVNSMYGVYALTYLGAVFFLDHHYRSEWKKWLLNLGLFLGLASPAIWLTASAFGRSTTNPELWLLANRMQYPYHFYPLTWTKMEFLRFGVLVFLAIAFLFVNRQRMRKLFKHTVVWAGVSVLWVVYAFFAAYVAKSPAMLIMHPARGTDLWYCFAGIALIATCAAQLEGNTTLKQQVLAVAVCGATLAIWHPIGYALLGLSAIVLVWRPAQRYFSGKGATDSWAYVLTGLMVFTGLTSFHQNWTARGVNWGLQIEPSSVHQIAHWASQNTPVDAQFLVDPTWLSEWAAFRGLSKRPVFVTWQDGAAILWDRTYTETWLERFKAYGLDFTQPGLTRDAAMQQSRDRYQSLQDQTVAQLKSQFPLDYWIVPVEHASALPVAFQTETHKVLKLQ